MCMQLTNHSRSMKGSSGMIYIGDTSKKRMALTFDDGPEDIYTPHILEILREKSVKATFFVIGKEARAYSKLLKQIYKEGHAIGNHSWDHSKLPGLTDKQLIESIQSTTMEIEKITGADTDLFRPPYGSINDQQVTLLHEHGYRLIMWGIDTIDWSGSSAKTILSRVIEQATPGGIVLQHTIRVPEKLDETIKALPHIINQLRLKGFELVTVPILLDKIE
ncbi:Peptidoglycan/xylan/chitin deacetylase, PgdA/CDA1 family [Alteribacillus bidgolensis]|uniref:Peptidoglycan/xylan/chitin deacetylase, PgdA/CDA1 family n=2 Tax=Alteribacillus bidgolensis TaxID=930129 RepID=A0A1G8KU30_9BACI|nr:Peptidoglycan/xylan/chitin deacetylase, PgdA/CDA1 family [Alteribacillus bidgolensis]